MDVDVKESLKKKLVMSGLILGGHVERIRDETLAKRTDAQSGGEKEARKTEDAMGGQR